MKIFRFDRETGKIIDRFGSTGFTLTRVAHLLEETMIQCAYLEPGGVIGYHQATVFALNLRAPLYPLWLNRSYDCNSPW